MLSINQRDNLYKIWDSFKFTFIEYNRFIKFINKLDELGYINSKEVPDVKEQQST